MKKTEKPPKNHRELANGLAEEKNCDILLYNGPISRPHDNNIIKMMRDRPKRDNLILFLATDGGDPDVAYRISRHLQESYKNFAVMLAGFCKSAGTIICLGAHELIFTDLGEMGPLDVQLAKSDELWRVDSGLNLETSLDVLRAKSYQMMENTFLSLTKRSGGRITTKTAMQVACQMTGGLFGKIYEHIEPLQIGECARSMQIAEDYGERLNAVSKNLKGSALSDLVAKYSTHGFVIDFKEAKGLFNKVRMATQQEMELANTLGDSVESPGARPVIEFLSQPRRTENEKRADREETISGGSPAAEGEKALPSA